jgi:transposase
MPRKKKSAEATVREIRRRTRRKFSAEEKVRIVMEGLRGECSVAELCRREGISANLYYRWSKDFLEAGKKRLAGDTVREANTDSSGSLSMSETDRSHRRSERRRPALSSCRFLAPASVLGRFR